MGAPADLAGPLGHVGQAVARTNMVVYRGCSWPAPTPKNTKTPTNEPLLFAIAHHRMAGHISGLAHFRFVCSGCGLLASKVGLRGEQWKDWSHHRWNNALRCVHKMGLSKVKFERTMCLNLGYGPWHGHSHWHTLREAFFEYHRSSSHQCPLLQLLIERIAKQRHRGELPSDFGTEDFAKRLWDDLPHSQYWGGIKNEVKLNRFFSFCGRSRELRPDEGVLLLSLLYIGINRRWFQGIDDTPLCSSPKALDFSKIPEAARAPLSRTPASASSAQSSSASSSTTAPSRGAVVSSSGAASVGGAGLAASDRAVAAAASVAPPAKTTMARSNDEVDNAARKIENTMHACRLSLANPAMERLAVLIDEVPRPLEVRHSLEMTTLETQSGLLRWHCLMSNGEFTEPLVELARSLESPEVLRKMGFRDAREVHQDSAEMQEEGVMATIVASFVRMLIATELQSLRTFYDRPPGRFAALLHESEDARQFALEYCKQLFDALLFFEHQALEDRWIADYVSKLVWPANTWVRETLIGLSGCNFDRLPEDIAENLQHSFRGFGRTIAAENTFGAWSELSQRSSKTKRVGRSIRWFHAHQEPGARGERQEGDACASGRKGRVHEPQEEYHQQLV